MDLCVWSVRTCKCMNVCIICVSSACMCICTYVCMYVCFVCLLYIEARPLILVTSNRFSWYVCTYACMYARMHVCMYVCLHTCMYVSMYVCMYACIYVFSRWFSFCIPCSRCYPRLSTHGPPSFLLSHLHAHQYAPRRPLLFKSTLRDSMGGTRLRRPPTRPSFVLWRLLGASRRCWPWQALMLRWKSMPSVSALVCVCISVYVRCDMASVRFDYAFS